MIVIIAPIDPTVINSFGPLCTCSSGVDVTVGITVGASAITVPLLTLIATLQFPIGLTEPDASVKTAVAV
jgi:hypothetical protein